MLTKKDGVDYKLVCPSCGNDSIGRSGMGGNLVHCFNQCMADVPQSECLLVEVTSAEELQALSQEEY